LLQRGLDVYQRLGHELGFHCLFSDHVLVGQTHAVGAEYPRQRVHKHARHAQGIGHQTSMLAARAAKALQRVARHVVAARHADLLDGIGHLLHGDLNEAMGHILGLASGLCGEAFKLLRHRIAIQRLVGRVAKHLGEMCGLDLAHHHVRIRHGQRAATAVAGGARVGARAFWADAEACAIKAEDGSAAGCHGMDAHHGRAHAHAGHLGFELALELACVVAHVGAGATHVKADDLVVARQACRARHADDAASRA